MTTAAGAGQPTAGQARWADALLAAALFGEAPHAFGGMAVRARAGPVRDRFVALLMERLAPGLPRRRLPPGADRERIVGGLDLEATLAARRPVMQPGLLAEADGGLLLVPMAERMARQVAGLLAATLDSGRTGGAEGVPARVALLLLDEGEADEAADPGLLDRLAFHLDLDGLGLADMAGEPEAVVPARAVDDALAIEALALTAARLGVDSPRAVLHALAAARLLGGGRCDEAGLAAAARLVLAPRATRLPGSEPAPPPPPEPPPAQPQGVPEAPETRRDEGRDQDSGEGRDQGSGERLPDMLVEAARAALPPGLLAALAAGGPAKRQGRGAERSGAQRGRPAGTRPGLPRDGRRLALVETLRAAAPWQRLRSAAPGRVAIRREDLRIRRTREKATTLALFLVDASGSAAAERLAEAKGAVELLLADAYVTRAEVALIAFRGARAELLLSPTRSLTRARRALAGLPGGGGTPLAAALALGDTLARRERAAGKAVRLVVLTDGRANVALDGSGGREAASAEALALARRVRAAGLAATVIDISARPRPEAGALAEALGARFVALPRGPAPAIAAAAGVGGGRGPRPAA